MAFSLVTETSFSGISLSNVDMGTIGTDRLVIVQLGQEAQRVDLDVTDVTIGGVSASGIYVAEFTPGSGSTTWVAVFYESDLAAIGGIQTVSVSKVGSSFYEGRLGGHVYVFSGLPGAAYKVWGSNSSSGGSPVTVPITYGVGDFVFGGASDGGSATVAGAISPVTATDGLHTHAAASATLHSGYIVNSPSAGTEIEWPAVPDTPRYTSVGVAFTTAGLATQLIEPQGLLSSSAIGQTTLDKQDTNTSGVQYDSVVSGNSGLVDVGKTGKGRVVIALVSGDGNPATVTLGGHAPTEMLNMSNAPVHASIAYWSEDDLPLTDLQLLAVSKSETTTRVLTVYGMAQTKHSSYSTFASAGATSLTLNNSSANVGTGQSGFVVYTLEGDEGLDTINSGYANVNEEVVPVDGYGNITAYRHDAASLSFGPTITPISAFTGSVAASIIVFDVDQIVSIQPTGVTSSETIGTPSIVQGAGVLSPSGITSEEAFGTASPFDPAAIPVTVVASASASGSGLAAITHGLTIQEGDILLGLLSYEGDSTSVNASTSNIVYSDNGDTPFGLAGEWETDGAQTGQFVYRLCGPNEPATYNWKVHWEASTPSNEWSLHLLQIRNANPNDLFDSSNRVSSQIASTEDLVTFGSTATTNGCLHVLFSTSESSLPYTTATTGYTLLTSNTTERESGIAYRTVDQGVSTGQGRIGNGLVESKYYGDFMLRPTASVTTAQHHRVQPTSDSAEFVVTVPSGNASKVQCSLSSDFATVIESTSVTPTAAAGYHTHFTVNGLTSLRTYFWRVVENGVVEDGHRTFSTLPADGQVGSFTWAVSGCNASGNNSTAASRILNRQVDAMLWHGDWHYDDVEEDYGNPTREQIRYSYNTNLAGQAQKDLLDKLGMYYIYDDHDSLGNNANLNSYSNWTQLGEAYRDCWPTNKLADQSGSPVYYSHRFGHVLLLMLDGRATNTNFGGMLDDTQQAWAEAEIAAAGADPNIQFVWMEVNVPWVVTSTGGDNWNNNAATQADAVSLITALTNAGFSSDQYMTTAGDMHGLAWDDGTSVGNPGNGRHFQSGPMGQDSSNKGGPYSGGDWDSFDPTAGQYTTFNFDSQTVPNQLTITAKGYDHSDTNVYTESWSVGLPIIIGANSIDSSETFGTPAVLPGAVTLGAVSVPSAEAVGTALVVPEAALLSAVGIPSVAAFGQINVRIVAPLVSITSDEVFGTVAIIPGEVIAIISSLTQTEAIGVVNTTTGGVAVTPIGLASQEILPSPIVEEGPITLVLASVNSGESVGTVTTAQGAVTVALVSLSSDEQFGTPNVGVGLLSIPAVGLISQESLGTVTTTTTVSTAVLSIDSTEAVSDVAILVAGSFVVPTSITSAETFGVLSANTGIITLLPPSVDGEESFGTPTLTVSSVVISPISVDSQEIVGLASLVPEELFIAPPSILSQELVGVVTTTQGGITIIPLGVGSSTDVGSVSLSLGGSIVELTGIATEEAMGTAFVSAATSMTLTAIASGETFGTPIFVTGEVIITPLGLPTDSIMGGVVLVGGIPVESGSKWTSRAYSGWRRAHGSEHTPYHYRNWK